MHLIDRRDTPLAIAFIVGAITMFAQPLRFVLSTAEEVSRTYQVDLIPGLMIFVLVFTLHYWRKYRDTAVQADRVTHAAEHATAMAAELRRLIAASQALASALDVGSLRAHVSTHMHALLGPGPVWLARRGPTGWEWLVEPTSDADALLDVAPAIAHTSISPSAHGPWRVLSIRAGEDVLALLGSLHSSEDEPTELAHVEAFAAMVGVSLRNVQLVEQLHLTSATDALTGCGIRSFGLEQLKSELRRARRSGSSLAVLMIDLDGFKAVNDQHGHVMGDQLLASVGQMLRRSLRITDIKCRYGGDEFLIVLPDTPRDAARQVVSNIRDALSQLRLFDDQGAVIHCSASVGLATSEQADMDPLAVIQRADRALYDDKARPRAAQPSGPTLLPVPAAC